MMLHVWSFILTVTLTMADHFHNVPDSVQENELRRVHGSLSQIQHVNEMLMEKLATLEEGVQQLQAKVEHLEDENRISHARIDILETENSKKQEIIEQIHQKNHDLSSLYAVGKDSKHIHELTGNDVAEDVGGLKTGNGNDNKHNKQLEKFFYKEDENETDEKDRLVRATLASDTPIVVFYATLTSDAHQLGQGQNIVFDHAHINLGNAYHTFHGIFTAPYRGLYMFSATLACNYNDQVLFANFVVNGNAVARTRGYRYDLLSHTVFLELNQSDDFSIQSQGNMGASFFLGNQFSSIAGRLVTLLD